MGKKKSDNEKYKKRFESFQSTKYTDDDYKTIFDNEDVIKSKSFKGALKGQAENVALLISMLKDIFTRKYKEIPARSIAAIAGTLLYIFSPIDIIPDVIFGVGLADDAAILALCLQFIKMDIDKYKIWRENNIELGNDFDE